MKDTYILGIESSCDEMSASIIKNGTEEIKTIILSQMDIHKQYGGVVPEIASRCHIESSTMVLEELFENLDISMEDIDAIAVTYGPGLVGSLLIGLQIAKTLSLVYNKPLVPVHHIAGHIYANSLVKKFSFFARGFRFLFLYIFFIIVFQYFFYFIIFIFKVFVIIREYDCFVNIHQCAHIILFCNVT